jgi:anti-sigma B factor antagonist/stage II sporulation protein AA (anti-sigma F factor antagonist)
VTAEVSTDVTTDQASPLAGATTVSTDEWRAVVELKGEIDLANVAQLRSELSRHIESGRRVLHVNARALTFIDSSAIGELVTASRRCREGGGTLILTEVPPRLHRLISIAGLEQVLLVDTASAG